MRLFLCFSLDDATSVDFQGRQFNQIGAVCSFPGKRDVTGDKLYALGRLGQTQFEPNAVDGGLFVLQSWWSGTTLGTSANKVDQKLRIATRGEKIHDGIAFDSD